MIQEVFSHPLRLGPFAILAATVIWMAVATRQVTRQIGKGAYGFGQSSRQRWAQRLFRAAVAIALLASFAYAIHIPFPVVTPFSDLPAALLPAGMLSSVSGAIMTVVARSDMGRNWRVGVSRLNPNELVTTGLFAMSRNPVFAGMLTMAAGLVAALPSPTMIACAVVFWAACQMQVRVEEAFLEQAFGDEYRNYRRRVRRWI